MLAQMAGVGRAERNDLSRRMSRLRSELRTWSKLSEIA
jgi:hypothetical protein